MKILSNGVAVIGDEDILSREIKARGLCSDLMVRHSILQHIKPGDVIVDGGAAMGDHTVAYLEAVGPTGRVLAFEPNPDFLECLRHNCPKAEIHDRLLWDSDCEFYLHSPIENVGAGYLTSSPVNRPGETTHGPLHSIQLDDLNLDRLNFMKLDLEGAELFALQGGHKTIQRCRPKIVLEMNPGPSARFGLTAKDVYDLLDSWNYAHHSIRNQPGDYCTDCDILAVPL